MKPFPTNWYSAFSVLPNIIFAYDYQTNFFSIFKGLRNGNDKKMSLVSGAGIGGCCICYLVIGLVGYSLVGDNASANLLESLSYN
jgi:amino acid permease